MSSLKYPPDMKPGDIATLKVPYKGYRRIEIEVYEDEFETD